MFYPGSGPLDGGIAQKKQLLITLLFTNFKPAVENDTKSTIKKVRSQQFVKTYCFLFKTLFTNIIPLVINVDKSFQKCNCN